MLKFLSTYVRVLLSLLCAMGTYWLVVVPLIEPANSGSKKQSLGGRSLPRDHWWQEFFPEDSWQTQEPTIIHTKQGILLAKSWEAQSKVTWKLEPLTMIVPQTQKGRDAIRNRDLSFASSQDMWIVSANEGATIQFAEPPDFASGNATVVSGNLQGKIVVTRKAASEIDDSPWRLETRDLTIERTKVSTDQEVVIEWNNSIIRGHDLLVLLRSDLTGNSANSDTSSVWGPLDELRLYHVDEVDVALPNGGIWADMVPNDLAIQLPPGKQLTDIAARLKAFCAGRFVFDFKRSEASLQDEVRVEHSLEGISPDQFLCDKIVFDVDPKGQDLPPGAATQTTTDDSEQRGLALGNLRVKSLTATGADSVQDFQGEEWVEILAPTVGLQAKSKSLKVDLLRRQVTFDGRTGAPGGNVSNIALNYRGNQFQSPRLEYELPPEQAPQSHLGWLYSAGPGLASFQTEQGSSQPLRASWQSSLKLRPDTATQLPWIELLGKALVLSPEQGQLESNRLEVWLEERPVPADTPSGSLASDMTMRLAPKRVFSDQTTTLMTDMLQARVSQLELNLQYLPPPTPISEIESNDLSLSDARGNPMYQWVKPPEQASPTSAADAAVPQPSGSSKSPPSTAAQEPVVVEGGRLAANLVQQGEDNWIEQLQIDGPVDVYQTLNPQADEWHIRGDELLLATNPEGQADLQVGGTPARLDLGDGYLSGESIRVDQIHGWILMDHPGQLSVPKTLLERTDKPPRATPSEGLLSNQVQWIDSPQCTWQGRMVFDGSVIRIEGDVLFNAAFQTSPDQYWWTAGTSQLMEIYLADPIDLKGQADSLRDSEIVLERIKLSDQVTIRAEQRDRSGERRSRNQIQVPSIVFHAQEGRLVGRGLGVVHAQFLSEEGVGNLAGQNSRNDSTETLQGAYLTFRDSMVGLMDREEMTFDGKVELLSGPISGWDDWLSPDRVEKLKAEQLLLNSDQLKVYETRRLGQGQPASFRADATRGTWEFKATGNVAFNGQTDGGEYIGNGYQVTYSRLKNLLVLRGDGRKAAQLKRIPPDQSAATVQANIQSVAINPDSMEILDLKLGAGGVQVSNNSGVGRAAIAPRTFDGFSRPGSQLPSNGFSTPFEQGTEGGQSPIPDPRQDFYNRTRGRR